jgi:hypothetical protein
MLSPVAAQTSFFELCLTGTPAQITAALKAGADGKTKDNKGKTAFD